MSQRPSPYQSTITGLACSPPGTRERNRQGRSCALRRANNAIRNTRTANLGTKLGNRSAHNRRYAWRPFGHVTERYAQLNKLLHAPPSCTGSAIPQRERTSLVATSDCAKWFFPSAFHFLSHKASVNGLFRFRCSHRL